MLSHSLSCLKRSVQRRCNNGFNNCTRVTRQQQQLFSTLLSPEARVSAIANLPSSQTPFGWESDPSGRNAVTKTFHFTNFAEAWSWMNRIADVAENLNHHPEWTNVYNVVFVTLSTHDCGGVSELDIQMARKMDEIASDVLPSRET